MIPRFTKIQPCTQASDFCVVLHIHVPGEEHPLRFHVGTSYHLLQYLLSLARDIARWQVHSNNY